MAQDQGSVSEDEIEEAKEEIHDLFDDVREVLAEDLGGDPEDYQSDHAPVADGGE